MKNTKSQTGEDVSNKKDFETPNGSISQTMLIYAESIKGKKLAY